MTVKVLHMPVMFMLALLFSCSTQQHNFLSRPVKTAGFAESDQLQFEMLAAHYSDSSTAVYLKISNNNLLYKRHDSGSAFFAQFQIRAHLFSADNDRKILDTVALVINDRSDTELVNQRYFYPRFQMQVPKGQYNIVIELRDVNRKVKVSQRLAIDKRNADTPQNFLLYANDSISFRNYFSAGEKIQVAYTRNYTQRILVKEYRKQFGAALAPFNVRENTAMDLKPDTLYFVELGNGVCSLKMPETGFVRISRNFEAEGGLTLFDVDEGFPGLSTTEEMIQCTRYIMSKEEYEACLNADDPKAAIDQFWLRIGGSKERAKELLRRYYGRVLEANRMYSSFMPGWKTDRGMIYIVMGQAYSVFDGRDAITWIYGNEANPNSLRFVFRKREQAITENDYIMERSVFYRDSYHSAVDYWRQGMVYNDRR